MSYGVPMEILDNYELQEAYDTGYYTDGLGIEKKIPSNIYERSLIYNAIIKRTRKAKRNLDIYERNNK